MYHQGRNLLYIYFLIFKFNLVRVQLGINDLIGSLFCTVLSLVKKKKNPQI